jgi:DNA-binding HxlR family transcriptional regulator
LVPLSPMKSMTGKTTVYDERYPSRRLLDLIGDKWTPIVLYVLGHGTKRYGEMQRHLPDISKKMLTQTLRTLEGGGLLRRTVYAEVPPRVEYDLTALGRIYLEPVTALCRWATKHLKDLDAVKTNRQKARRRK